MASGLCERCVNVAVSKNAAYLGTKTRQVWCNKPNCTYGAKCWFLHRELFICPLLLQGECDDDITCQFIHVSACEHKVSSFRFNPDAATFVPASVLDEPDYEISDATPELRDTNSKLSAIYCALCFLYRQSCPSEYNQTMTILNGMVSAKSLGIT